MIRDRGNGEWGFNIFAGGIKSAQVTTGAQSTNTWQHLVLVLNSDELTAYIDGSAVETDTSNSGPSPNAGGAVRCGYSVASDRYLDGQVDDPRVYDKGLSSTEVSNLYNTGSISG